jgi:hypothetical protein
MSKRQIRKKRRDMPMPTSHAIPRTRTVGDLNAGDQLSIDISDDLARQLRPGDQIPIEIEESGKIVGSVEVESIIGTTPEAVMLRQAKAAVKDANGMVIGTMQTGATGPRSMRATQREATKVPLGYTPTYIQGKLTPEQQQENADIHLLEKLLKGRRWPEHVPLFHKAYLKNMGQGAESVREHRHPETRKFLTEEDEEWILELDANRDLYLYHQLTKLDTKFFFAGPEFCDLVEATDAPALVDISVLRKIGNHTGMVLFARNIYTEKPGDALIGMVLSIAGTDVMSDGVPRLIGSVFHEDNSFSTFSYSFYHLEDDDLVQVGWDNGINERAMTEIESKREHQLLTNTLAFLALESVVTQTPWNHYPKAVKARAKAKRRKLPEINVLTLGRRVQQSLDEHQDVKAKGKKEWDHCWPVKGYFREQRVGPGRKQRRRTYVHPCVRGNLEGPLIARTQVHQSA